jgi:hypothetical protein
MSIERLFHWTCDACSAVEIRNDYGLPQGWIFVKGMRITHRCEKCKGDVSKDKIGQPQVTAKR